MEDINLHFTGDFHAITTRAQPARGADRQSHLLGQRARHRHPPRRVAPRRGHERPRAARDHRARSAASPTAIPREAGFDITVASEVMAILCLATDLKDLEKRLGNIIVGYTREQEAGLRPRPQGARRHGGRCSRTRCSRTSCRRWRTTRPSSTAAPSPTSRMAATRWWPPRPRSSSPTTSSPKPASAPTWAPRSSSTSSAARPGLKPAAAVIVATVRALKMHGGVKKEDLEQGECRGA